MLLKIFHRTGTV